MATSLAHLRPLSNERPAFGRIFYRGSRCATAHPPRRQSSARAETFRWHLPARLHESVSMSRKNLSDGPRPTPSRIPGNRLMETLHGCQVTGLQAPVPWPVKAFEVPTAAFRRRGANPGGRVLPHPLPRPGLWFPRLFIAAPGLWQAAVVWGFPFPPPSAPGRFGCTSPCPPALRPTLWIVSFLARVAVRSFSTLGRSGSATPEQLDETGAAKLLLPGRPRAAANCRRGVRS
jgi:hypothetical protein